MIFLSKQDPADYGRVVSWPEYASAEQLLKYGVGLYPGRGLVIL